MAPLMDRTAGGLSLLHSSVSPLTMVNAAARDAGVSNGWPHCPNSWAACLSTARIGYIKDESVDLVYLDPPFQSNRAYNVLFKEHTGADAASQMHAFEDTWRWDQVAARTYQTTVEHGGQLAETLQALARILGHSDMLAYLAMMAPRLVELHRVLKSTGSLYLHCDPTASHYLKLVLDAVFGPQNFRNEIIWKRTSSHGNVRRKYADLSDSLLFYTKGEDYTFNLQYTPYTEDYIRKFYRHMDADGRRYLLDNLRNPSRRPNLMYDYKGYKPHPNGWACTREKMEQYDRDGLLYFPKEKTGRIRFKRYLDTMHGTPVGNVWDDIRPVQSQAAERLGYPTQKPLGLLERIIKATCATCWASSGGRRPRSACSSASGSPPGPATADHRRAGQGKGVAYPAWSANTTYMSAPQAQTQGDKATQQPLWPQDGERAT